MPNPRLGLYDGSIMTPFPRRLMNTAVSPTMLRGDNQARFIENILPNALKAGSGAKRHGVVKKGNAIGGADILDVMEYRTSAGTLELLAYLDDGSIRRLNESTGVWTSLKTGLAANGNPRWVMFNEKIIIVDGVNPNMSYNGSTISNLSEYVYDFDPDNNRGLATAATQVDTNTLTIDVAPGRSDYANGKSIKVRFDTAGEVTATITSVSGSGTLTIDVSGTPFPSPAQTIKSVAYEASPPPFSDIYSEHQRLWALSSGETRANVFRNPQNAMRVYYTDATNNENTWFNEVTQEVGYVNLLNRSRRFDELVRISSIDGMMVFFGRLSTFIYAGDDPTTLGEFAWQKTIPVGCINGNLVQKYPSDILFFTRYGARSLRTVFQTEGQEVVPDLGSDVDPTVTQFISAMMTSDAQYRGARSFFYERDGFYGFTFGTDYALIYALSEESKGWVYFSGIFKDASAFYGTSDGRLIMARGGQLYAYANGTDGATTYDDDGDPILMKWWTPWLAPKRGRWANIGFELIMEDISETTIQISRATDSRDDSVIVVGEFALTTGSSLWGEAEWGVSLWGSRALRLNLRDKFLSDNFSIILENNSTSGPLSFIGLKPIGK